MVEPEHRIEGTMVKKGTQVKVDEPSHYHLAIHSVADASMARNQVGEILDLYRSFEPGSKESPEGPNGAGKQ